MSLRSNGNRKSTRHVTACIPYFRCKAYIRRAVTSLLSQTHRDLTVVVINDGDPDPPWDRLADIRDPRLVRHGTAANYGQYFATELVLRLTESPYFLIQDADDYSQPRRVLLLLRQLEREGSDLAVSAQPQCHQFPDGSMRVIETRWDKVSNSASAAPKKPFVIDLNLTSVFRYRAPHHGLFRTASLRNVGGYNFSFRINYDALVANLILAIGTISHLPIPLYQRVVRHNSVTHSSRTGPKSRAATAEYIRISEMYDAVYGAYREYLAGRVDSHYLSHFIQIICGRVGDASLRQAFSIERDRLRERCASNGTVI